MQKLSAILLYTINTFVRCHSSTYKGPSYWKPKAKTAQCSIFTVFDCIKSKCADSTERSHNPENDHLSLLSSSPPVYNYHSKIKIRSSDAPSEIECKDISHNVSPGINLVFRYVSDLDPCKQNENWQSNKDYRGKYNRN